MLDASVKPITGLTPDDFIVTESSNTKIVGQLSKRLEVTLNPSVYARMITDGLTATVHVPVSGVATMAKVVVYDPATDTIGSVSAPVR